jgi:hypothetical protein
VLVKDGDRVLALLGRKGVDIGGGHDGDGNGGDGGGTGPVGFEGGVVGSSSSW